MKHFIIEVTYLAPLEQIDQVVGEHRAYLKIGYDRGWLLFSGPQEPRTGGMVVARAPSKEDIVAFFKNDPYNLKGMASYRITEVNPVRFQPFIEGWLKGE